MEISNGCPVGLRPRAGLYVAFALHRVTKHELCFCFLINMATMQSYRCFVFAALMMQIWNYCNCSDRMSGLKKLFF